MTNEEARDALASTFGTIAVMFTLAACGAAQWFGKLAYRLTAAPNPHPKEKEA